MPKHFLPLIAGLSIVGLVAADVASVAVDHAAATRTTKASTQTLRATQVVAESEGDPCITSSGRSGYILAWGNKLVCEGDDSM